MQCIIFIQHEPLTPNIERRYCISDMLLAGFDVMYWDISQILYPGLKCADELTRNYCVKLLSYEDLKYQCTKVGKGDIIIPEFFFGAENKKVWKIVCSTNALLIKLERYGNTNLAMSESVVSKLLRHLSIKSVIRFIKHRKFLSYAHKNNIRQYDKLFTSQNVKCDLRINHPDYDDYLLHKDEIPLLDYKYICFIDVGFGIHPDELFYDKICNDNVLWQSKLNNFFDYIEKKYGMPVVIAVHPKINYPSTAFGGREKVKYKTLNLVLNSELVLQDMSNSISFSIIANKKIGLIVTNEFFDVYSSYLKMLSGAVQVQLFNIDKDEWDSFSPVAFDDNIRKEYIHNYLCNDVSGKKTTAEMVVEYLRNI
jgi:hypothetical protein